MAELGVTSAAITGVVAGDLVRPTVCLSTHWMCTLCPETRSAWSHYAPGIPDLVRWATDSGIELLGHGHPRIFKRLRRAWDELGIEAVESFDEVLARSSLYVCDSSSTLYEFASTGRPVLCLNAPWYRRDVEHGLRFWSHVPGLQCDGPEGLIASIERALSDPPYARQIREHAVRRVYTACDGQAAQRAADAIRAVAENTPDGGRVTRGRAR